MSNWTAFLIPISAGASVIWAKRAARSPARQVGEDTIVEFSLAIRILGTAVALACAYLSAYLILLGVLSYRGLAIFASATIFPMTLFFVALALYWWFTQIRFGTEYLQVRSPWRRPRRIPWSALQDVQGGPNSYRIETNGYGSVRFNSLQRGHLALLEAVAREAKQRSAEA